MNKKIVLLLSLSLPLQGGHVMSSLLDDYDDTPLPAISLERAKVKLSKSLLTADLLKAQGAVIIGVDDESGVRLEDVNYKYTKACYFIGQYQKVLALYAAKKRSEIQPIKDRAEELPNGHPYVRELFRDDLGWITVHQVGAYRWQEVEDDRKDGAGKK